MFKYNKFNSKNYLQDHYYRFLIIVELFINLIKLTINLNEKENKFKTAFKNVVKRLLTIIIFRLLYFTLH